MWPHFWDQKLDQNVPGNRAGSWKIWGGRGLDKAADRGAGEGAGVGGGGAGGRGMRGGGGDVRARVGA